MVAGQRHEATGHGWMEFFNRMEGCGWGLQLHLITLKREGLQLYQHGAAVLPVSLGSADGDELKSKSAALIC